MTQTLHLFTAPNTEDDEQEATRTAPYIAPIALVEAPEILPAELLQTLITTRHLAWRFLATISTALFPKDAIGNLVRMNRLSDLIQPSDLVVWDLSRANRATELRPTVEHLTVAQQEALLSEMTEAMKAVGRELREARRWPGNKLRLGAAQNNFAQQKAAMDLLWRVVAPDAPHG